MKTLNERVEAMPEGYIDYVALHRDKELISKLMKFLWGDGNRTFSTDEEFAFMKLYMSIVSDDLQPNGCCFERHRAIESMGWDNDAASIIDISLHDFINKHEYNLIHKRWLCEYNKHTIGQYIYKAGVPEGIINYCD